MDGPMAREPEAVKVSASEPRNASGAREKTPVVVVLPPSTVPEKARGTSRKDPVVLTGPV
jgi:hypothetical protein